MSEASARQRQRGVALVAVMALGAATGVALRTRGDAAELPPCEAPALKDGVLRCDGEGLRPGARAWLAGKKLDVNDATTAELELIAGIGPSLARAIVQTRNERGRFARFEDLDDVPGIGPKTLDKLREHLAVSPP